MISDWSAYSRLRIQQHLKMTIYQMIVLLVLLYLTLFVSPGFSPLLIFPAYCILFCLTQIYYYYRVGKDSSYDEHWFSKLLYGGK
jgi:hypothetical protein